MLVKKPRGQPLRRSLILIASAGAVLVFLGALQQSDRGQPALAAAGGIGNIGTFLEQCPTNDSIYPLIRSDFQIRREGVVVGALSCTEPISALPDAQYTDELMAVQALRTIFHMEGGRSVAYPWTQGSFYDWMKSKIGGVDIRANGSYCCENYDGKWFVVIRSQSGFERRQDKQWRGLSEAISLLGHETRHVEGFPHVGGCPLFPTAGYGCDQTYDPSNPSAYGVQWWLHANWLSGELNVGLGCLESATTIATAHLNAANNDYGRRFVTQSPPVLTMPQLPGGPCPGSSPPPVPTPTPGMTPVIPTATPRPLIQGDVNCDGRVSGLDGISLVRFAMQMSVSQKEPCPDIGTTIGRVWGDLDCSGGVDSVDAVKALRHAFLQPVTQNEPCPDLGTPMIAVG
jgi:hypothetical protein